MTYYFWGVSESSIEVVLAAVIFVFVCDVGVSVLSTAAGLLVGTLVAVSELSISCCVVCCAPNGNQPLRQLTQSHPTKSTATIAIINRHTFS